MRIALITPLMILGVAVVVHAQGYIPYFNAVGPGSYRHASTIEEGAARGMADVVRSAGAANLMNSEAAINIEEARRKYIENRLQGTQTYFQMKSINKQYRDAQRNPPTQQQAIRLSKSRLPERLSANKLDPLTGELSWPLALRMEAFEFERERLDDLYAERADKGYLNAEEYIETKRLTDSMAAELRKYSQQIGGNASIEARKFLESLVYEASFQAG